MTNTVPLTSAEINSAYKRAVGLLDLPTSEWGGEWAKYRPAHEATPPATPAPVVGFSKIKRLAVEAALLSVAAFACFLPAFIETLVSILGE